MGEKNKEEDGISRGEGEGRSIGNGSHVIYTARLLCYLLDDWPLPEFHGEPVPSDDEEAIFLEAAGLPRKDKKPKHRVIEEEAPPSHEHILMDYYHSSLNTSNLQQTRIGSSSQIMRIDWN
ncbi:hypothetical protein PFISCL1PPCAC_24879 [Pristionchus fissidentatus]|uniref:Uncharacterized protein n=1 Tax=Pristionchus fissidentatus TaxID=1538716 RepID=A0AAV5WUZ8_9BILA|nr:hypothetical protein PFISCL1PPCAC_24879 [Pristionchus fissidentatus]